MQQKLRQEVINHMGDEPMDVEPTLEQLKEMEYLNLVIKEVYNFVIRQHVFIIIVFFFETEPTSCWTC